MISQRILVTGGAGFIGSHTVDLLLHHGCEVTVLDNLSSGKLAHLNLQHPRLHVVEGDILDYPLVAALISNCDAVLHLAAIASVPMSIENPIYTFQVNVQGMLHVLQAIHQMKRPIRFVFASSAAVYGDAAHLPCCDTLPLTQQPLSPYALQKINNEEYAKLYAQCYGVSALALRYFNVYGLRQDPHSPYSGVISRFLEAYQQQRALTVFGDGSQSRDFIYVEDVARANWLALQNQFVGALNIATGKPQTIFQLIDCIEKNGGKPALRAFQPARAGDIHSSFAKMEKAKESIGFCSTTSLEAGISRVMTELTIP